MVSFHSVNAKQETVRPPLAACAEAVFGASDTKITHHLFYGWATHGDTIDSYSRPVPNRKNETDVADDQCFAKACDALFGHKRRRTTRLIHGEFRDAWPMVNF